MSCVISQQSQKAADELRGFTTELTLETKAATEGTANTQLSPWDRFGQEITVMKLADQKVLKCFWL